MSNLKQKYKFFKGSLTDFKTWLNNLDRSSDAYKEIHNSIVWIHPNLGDDNISEEDLKINGSIYVHGIYIHASSSSDVMKVVDGVVYINGLDVNGDKKLYRVLTASDISSTVDDSSVVTSGYLKAVNQFESLN